MSKRNFVVAMMAVLLALSAVAFAALPGTPSTAVTTDEESLAALQFDLQPPAYPYCPGPEDSGCTDGP